MKAKENIKNLMDKLIVSMDNAEDPIIYKIILEGLYDSLILLKCYQADQIPKDIDDPEIEHVYLFNMERISFWKQDKRGYTKDRFNAGIFKKEEAIQIIENNPNKKNKIISFL